MPVSRSWLKLVVIVIASMASVANMNAVLAQTPAVSIDGALQNITTLVRMDRVGYATFWDGNIFVQCRRLSAGDMRCDAAGTVLQPSLKSVLNHGRIKKLVSLGWSINADFGNYRQDFPRDVPTGEIAELVLQTFVDGYGANVSRLEMKTAWVADVPCPPRAGPSQNLAGSVNDDASMRSVVIRTCAYAPPPQLEPKAASNIAELLAIYGANVTAEIQRLRLNSTRRVWIIFAAGIGYVQCAPETSPAGIYCEAQSAQSWPDLAVVLTPDRIKRLKALGYADPGRAPNYSRNYPSGTFTDAAVAGEVLKVLHDAYGYTGASPLKLKTEQGIVAR